MPRRRTLSERLSDAALFLAKASLIGLIASLGYLCWVAFGDVFRDYPQGFSPEASQLAVRNLTWASRVLTASCVGLTVSGTLLWLGVPWLPFVPGVLGGVLYAGLPRLASSHLSDASRVSGRPGAILLGAWSDAGIVLLVAGALLLAHLGWLQLRDSLTRQRKGVGGLKVPFYSACWQTHHCKEALRAFCATGRGGFAKSCWRYKSGCFCDASMADQMLAIARKKGSKPLPGAGRPARGPRMTFLDHFCSTHHRIPGQVVACADCPIYQYHQVQKHRILAPIVVMAVPVLAYVYREAYHAGWLKMMASAEGFARNVAFTPRNTTLVAEQVRGALGEPAIEFLVATVITLWCMTLAARLVEWWCFQLKL